MNYSINNRKNKKCKIYQNYLKKHAKHAKNTYIMLNISTIDKTFSKLLKEQPNLFPEHVVYSQRDTLFALSKKISHKINSQIVRYKSRKALCIVEYIAKDCAKQIILQKEVDVFQYASKVYGYTCFNKKEFKIFPYLLAQYIYTNIFKLLQLLKTYVYEIEYGAVCDSQIFKKLSLANIYGIAKYNQNYTQIAQNLRINYKKCVFKFISKLLNIELKLKICTKYLRYLSLKFGL